MQISPSLLICRSFLEFRIFLLCFAHGSRIDDEVFVYTDEAVVDEDIIEEKEHTDALSSAYKLSFSDDMNRLADSST